MAEHNKLIPNEKLSTREKIERKAKFFGHTPFTLKDINKLLRPRMKLMTIRFHVENLVNNLYIEKLPREGREEQLYVYRDLLKDPEFVNEIDPYLVDLRKAVRKLREGEVVTQKDLVLLRSAIRESADTLEKELRNLLIIHDCTDLWDPATLVARLGFLDGE